jgi:hypothetical protein
MQNTDPNVVSVSPHVYDRQCRCSSCTAQEFVWQKTGMIIDNDDKKSRLLQELIQERERLEFEAFTRREEWLSDPNPGSWDAYQNAENKLRRAQAFKI